MPDATMLATLVADELPAFIRLLRALFALKHPDERVPSPDEVGAAITEFRLSIKTDDEWLAAHPEKP